MALMMAPDAGLTDDTANMSSDASGAGTGAASFGMGLEGAGALFSAYGAIYAGQMEGAALDAQANIQRQNAELDLAAGRANATKSMIMSGQRIGAIQGAAAAGGVTQSGSVLSVMAASSMNAEMDRQNILHGAQVKAVQAENQASMDELGAKSALQGSYFKAVGDVIQGVADIATAAAL